MSLGDLILIFNKRRKAKKETARIKQIEDKYLKDAADKKVNIVGLPNSGKTVYFCVCMDLLQRKLNERDDNCSVIYETAKTDQVVNSVIANLRDKGAEGWPANTQEPVEHHVSITTGTNKYELCFKDYSGEEFVRVYGNPDYLVNTYATNGQLETQSDNSAISIFENIQNNQLNNGGIIIIISSTLLLNKNDHTLSICLFNLLKELEIKQFCGKLALVITQGDRIKNIKDINIEKLFKQQQANSYARLKKTLRCEFRFFLVTAVDCEIDEHGEYVPPKNYSPVYNSVNVCDPIEWLMDINLD